MLHADEVNREAPAIDVVAVLQRLSGNRLLFMSLLEMFVESYPDIGVKTRAACGRGDIDAASQLLHALKGTAGNLSMTRLVAAAASLEEALRQKCATGTEQCLRELEQAHAEILTIIAGMERPQTSCCGRL